MTKLTFVCTPYMPAKASDDDAAQYYLCVEADGSYALEIIKAAEFAKPFYAKKRYQVIGAADSRADAFALVRRITEDFVKDGRGFDAFSGYLRALGESTKEGDPD